MTLYEFQSTYKDDDTCLLRWMQNRYRGTHIDSPKCDAKANFYRTKRECTYA